jgi:hypothetical protein
MIMIIFKSITEATTDVLGRKRSRYETEIGCTWNKKYEEKVYESIRMIRTNNTSIEDQSVSEDYSVITVKNIKDVEVFENNFFNDEAIHYFIGGAFSKYEKATKTIKVNGFGGRKVVEYDKEVKCDTLYAKFKVDDITYTNDGGNVVTLVKV